MLRLWFRPFNYLYLCAQHNIMYTNHICWIICPQAFRSTENSMHWWELISEGFSNNTNLKLTKWLLFMCFEAQNGWTQKWWLDCKFSEHFRCIFWGQKHQLQLVYIKSIIKIISDIEQIISIHWNIEILIENACSKKKNN